MNPLQKAVDLMERTRKLTEGLSEGEIAIVIATSFQSLTMDPMNTQTIIKHAEIIEKETQKFKEMVERNMNPKAPEGWKHVEAAYDKSRNTLILNASKKDFDPKFLSYMIQSMGMPADVKIEFLK